MNEEKNIDNPQTANDTKQYVMCSCDACGKQYEEPTPDEIFGEFNVCPECKLRTDVCWE